MSLWLQLYSQNAYVANNAKGARRQDGIARAEKSAALRFKASHFKTGRDIVGRSMDLRKCAANCEFAADAHILKSL